MPRVGIAHDPITSPYMALLASLLMLFHIVGPTATDLGVSNGELSPCPSRAHCAEAKWESTNPQKDLVRLGESIALQPRTLIVQQTQSYIHAEVSSAFFGFVDDLEILAAQRAIQARSISRIGDSDLGVNARRIAALKSLLYADSAGLEQAPSDLS